MIRRVTTDEESLEVDAIANDPIVKQTSMLGYKHYTHDLYFEDVVADAKNHVLIEDGFCAIFAWTSPGVYECHIMAMKQSRGASMFDAGKRMLAYMKEQGARQVWGQPSIYNRGAICYIRRMGLKLYGSGTHPMLGDVQYFVTEVL